jgi:hypothetical protein
MLIDLGIIVCGDTHLPSNYGRLPPSFKPNQLLLFLTIPKILEIEKIIQKIANEVEIELKESSPLFKPQKDKKGKKGKKPAKED